MKFQDLKKAHKGPFFKNCKASGAYVHPVLFHNLYILTEEKELKALGGASRWYVWGIYDGGIRIRFLTAFNNKERAIAEVSSEALRELYWLTRPRGDTARLYEDVENFRDLLCEHFTNEGPEDILTDALTNLRHIAEYEGLDFEKALSTSAMHFNREN